MPSPSGALDPLPKSQTPARGPLGWLRSGTFWIFFALALGVLAGGMFPRNAYPWAYDLFHFFSKAFIQLIKGLIVPLLVSTIIVGISQTGNLKAVGSMGAKALLYFEVVTTIALGIGLCVANVLRPGDGLPLDPHAHAQVATPKSGWELLLHLFPSNVIQHAAEGDVLPVVIFATLFGVSLAQAGPSASTLVSVFEACANVMFKYTHMVMRLTPVGVFGAMAYNVSEMASGAPDGSTGWSAVVYLLGRYARVVGSLYFSLILLFVCVFVPVLWLCRVPLRSFARHIKGPALTAFSTASSEAALPRLLEEMVALGVPRRVASFVIPMGYSFNLDGSTLYLVLASLTIAQAAKIEMPLSTQLTMMLVFMLTSKGVAGVPRATLVIIAATCAGFQLPGEAGVAMLLAVDEVMDMARTTINVVGNGLASVVVARWEKQLVLEPERQTPAEPL
ncbi:MAG TPA: dicarboxylate/amino acid:cation symporter [Polyangiaceae bacterium]|nr:dicarboxylate/amino acid:cation symporter [Polyangiaceae bacterium]